MATIDSSSEEVWELVHQAGAAEKEQRWADAIVLYGQAREIEPVKPEIFQALGAAEARIPGRELRAIGWYGAYLAASPKAKDAAAVRKLIAGLQTKADGNVARVITSAQEEAAKMAGIAQARAYIEVADLWVQAGNVKASIATLALVEENYPKTDVVAKPKPVAANTAEEGDFAGGTIANVESAFVPLPQGALIMKGSVQVKIAAAQLKAGNKKEAFKTMDAALAAAALINDPYQQGWTQADVALLQARAGDMARSLKTTGTIKSGEWSNFVLMHFVEERIKAGDLKGAAALKRPNGELLNPWQSIAEAQAKKGDIAGALKTNAQFGEEWRREEVAKVIAGEQARTGDVEGALKTAYDIKNDAARGGAREAIAEAQAAKGDFAGALKTAQLSQDTYPQGMALTALAALQLKAGNKEAARETLAAAVKSAVTLEDAHEKCDALIAIARAQADAGDTDGMDTTLGEALAAIAPVKDFYIRGKALADIAEVESAAGETAGAEITADSARASIDQIHGSLYQRSEVQATLVKMQADSGDIEQALAAIELIQDARPKTDALTSISEAQAKKGDIAGALKTAALIQDAYANGIARGIISEVQTRAALKDAPAAVVALLPAILDWTSKLDDDSGCTECPLGTAPFLDLNAYLATQHAASPAKHFQALDDTARMMLQAQDILRVMLNVKNGK